MLSIATQSPDLERDAMCCDLSLIDFIITRHSLVHDSDLAIYLQEFAGYTPGAHLLAALVAMPIGVGGVFVVHPIQAVLAALKAGAVYNVVLWLQPRAQRNP